ncbi:HipA domain-containing protein (plasmid) [Klebsiella michiganensis]|uniref:type II toxin-antitoxin system HipA family toxin n=1 Tax=Klebsiella michiganensis TaxID=1134687 RepID=UPI0021D95813|nr:HipA domain-containing protein [Klebsiella michiganensis]UYB60232.1 HipA domain-containing protein [Klebsiella michiganensis]
MCRHLGLSNKEQEQIYRRMVFNVVARNHDDHTKNWSFMVDDNFKWTLAPAFDVAWSYKADSPWVNAHQLTLAGKRDKFVVDDLLSVAKHITSLRPTKAKKIIDETIRIVSRWRDYAEDEGVPKALIESVQRSLRLTW